MSENAPVPADRRVWSIARSLSLNGWEVVVACAQDPAKRGALSETLDGIEIHRYPLRPADGGPAGYAREYAQAMWRLRALVRKLVRGRSFDVVHACNPPDFLLLAARAARRRGARLIFDHHDLVPELYRSRYGDKNGPGHRVALALERVAFRLADVSLATNESYRQVAIERGRMSPEDVFVVRNGPDLERFVPTTPDPLLRRGRDNLIAYVGIMGAQDGIDHALRALAWLRRRRQDWHAVLVGDGAMFDPMCALAVELGLGDCVEFAGWRDDADIRRILSTADVCLAPDPPSPLNEVSTMIKIAEYMAMGRAVASYELCESRRTAGEAAAYGAPGDPASLGRVTAELLGDPARRERMGRIGLSRVRRELAWQHAEPLLLAAYERALEKPTEQQRSSRERSALNRHERVDADLLASELQR